MLVTGQRNLDVSQIAAERERRDALCQRTV